MKTTETKRCAKACRYCEVLRLLRDFPEDLEWIVSLPRFELCGLKWELFIPRPETFAPNGLDNLNIQIPETLGDQKSPQFAGFFAKKAELSLLGKLRGWRLSADRADLR